MSSLFFWHDFFLQNIKLMNSLTWGSHQGWGLGVAAISLSLDLLLMGHVDYLVYANFSVVLPL